VSLYEHAYLQYLTLARLSRTPGGNHSPPQPSHLYQLGEGRVTALPTPAPLKAQPDCGPEGLSCSYQHLLNLLLLLHASFDNTGLFFM